MTRDPYAGRIRQNYRIWCAFWAATGATWATFTWIAPDPGLSGSNQEIEIMLGLLVMGLALLGVVKLEVPRPLCFFLVQAMQAGALGLFLLDTYWHGDSGSPIEIVIQGLALWVTCWPRCRNAISGGNPWGGWPGKIKTAWSSLGKTLAPGWGAANAGL